MKTLKSKFPMTMLILAAVVPGLSKDLHFTPDQREFDLDNDEAEAFMATNRCHDFEVIDHVSVDALLHSVKIDLADEIPSKDELRQKYTDLAGKEPDNRWSVKKLLAEIDNFTPEAPADEENSDPETGEETTTTTEE
jgi:hypothetical protein